MTKIMTLYREDRIKLAENKDIFYENFLFRFDGYGCDCVEDIIHISSGEEPNITFKLQSLPENKIKFAFAAKKGLVRIAPNGTVDEENILGSLIALPSKSDKVLKQFIKNNGFIFPVGSSSYEEFDKQQVLSIIERLRLTVDLMTAANEINKDYNQIFSIILKLLFAEEFRIKTESMEYEYTSCHYNYSDIFRNPPTNISYERSQEEFNSDVFKIKDLIYGIYPFNIGEYYDIIGGYHSKQGVDSTLFRNITAMYVNYNGSSIERKITDVLFHCIYEKDNSSQKLKDTLVEVANYIVGQEINANLKGIHPVYDSAKMMPSWKVDSLLCAAYFSIFYLKPNLELYRPCANPRCGKYFLVKTTSTRKIYCSPDCCNRVTQDRYRKNNRAKKE